MAGLTSVGVHGVRKIELSSFMPDNQNCRTLTITTDDGVIEINVFGRTEGLAAVPLAYDYRCTYSGLEIHAIAEAAE